MPGTEIALRRNAVPGRWNQRTTDDNYYVTPQGYVDCLPGAQCPATGGYLHNPGHQADIWYISVYTPSQALGDFVLTGGVLGAQPNGFDGIGGSAVVSDQLAGQWKFFRIDVPTDAVGWDIRLAGVSEGNPNYVVCRNSLPTELSTDPWPS